MANDLIGISKWSRVSLIPFNSTISNSLPKEPIEKIDKIYSSLGAVEMDENNKKLGHIVHVNPSKYAKNDIALSWINAIYKYPLAYLRYRWDLFAEIIGAKSHETFEPTHFNRIDENQFGIVFHDRAITDVVLNYIKSTSNMIIGKPWFFFILSFLSFFAVIKKPLVSQEAKLLSFFSFLSGSLYIFPFFIISGTGEVRYSFPAIILYSISFFVLVSQKFPSCKPPKIAHDS